MAEIIIISKYAYDASPRWQFSNDYSQTKQEKIKKLLGDRLSQLDNSNQYLSLTSGEDIYLAFVVDSTITTAGREAKICFCVEIEKKNFQKWKNRFPQLRNFIKEQYPPKADNSNNSIGSHLLPQINYWVENIRSKKEKDTLVLTIGVNCGEKDIYFLEEVKQQIDKWLDRLMEQKTSLNNYQCINSIQKTIFAKPSQLIYHIQLDKKYHDVELTAKFLQNDFDLFLRESNSGHQRLTQYYAPKKDRKRRSVWLLIKWSLILVIIALVFYWVDYGWNKAQKANDYWSEVLNKLERENTVLKKKLEQNITIWEGKLEQGRQTLLDTKNSLEKKIVEINKNWQNEIKMERQQQKKQNVTERMASFNQKLKEAEQKQNKNEEWQKKAYQEIRKLREKIADLEKMRKKK